MKKSSIPGTSLVILVLGIFLIMFVGSASPQNVQNSKDIETTKPPMPIIIKDQPDSPLTISSVILGEFQDPLMPMVYFNVVNNSGQQIMVYAIRHVADLGSRGALSGYIAVGGPDSKTAISPGQAPQVEISGIQYPTPPVSMTLSVDFIEFVGGVRWGEDIGKNGERIDGLRAGADATRDVIRQILKNEGPDALIRSLDSIDPQPDQSSSHSSQWRDGFRHGVGWMRARVRLKGPDAYKIEEELRRQVN